MRTPPRFRLKILLTTVSVIFFGLVVQNWASYRAFEAFFDAGSPFGFLVDGVLPLLWQALPIILLIGLAQYRRLGFLEKAVTRIASGETLPPADLAQAKKDLLAIPLWIFGSTAIGMGVGIVSQILLGLDSELDLLGLLQLGFIAIGGGLFSFLILGLIEIYLAVPRKLLHVTQVDDSLGKRTPRHRTTTLFVVFLAAWLVIFAVTTGATFSQLQANHTALLQEILAGGDKAELSTKYFDQVRQSLPSAGKAQGDDLTTWKPDSGQIGAFAATTFVLLTVLGILMWWFGTWNQSRQLGALRDRLNEALAGGNLDRQLEIVQFDEVGELASAINTLTRNQAERVARLTAAAQAVEAAFGPLSESSEEVNIASAAILESSGLIAEMARNEIGSVGAAEQSLTQALVSFEAISRSVEAQAGFVAEASSAMTEMASSIASVTRTTEDARALALRLKESSQAGTQSLGASVEAIRAIEAASKEVNALTASIAKISAQTNLLAMNAAIEAAHAGETGAGFAVVAEEVRNLALSSSESNKKIKQKTAEMLNLVGNGVRLTTEVGQAFERINADVAATAALVSEINSAMQEQNVGTDQILKSTAALVDTSHTIQRNAETQKEQNTQLQEAVGRITTSFQSIHQGAQDAARDGDRIRGAVVKLESVARAGQGVVDEMSALVNQQS